MSFQRILRHLCNFRLYGRMISRGVGMIVAAVLLTCVVGVASAQAATYYLAPGGNDGAAGTSTATAWRTFGRAWQTVRAGDTLLVMDGTYNQSIAPTVNGASGAPVTIKALNDGKVTIDGQGTLKPLNLGDGTGGGNWFVIEGLVMRNGPEHVALVKGANNVLRRVSVYDANTNVNSQPLLLWGTNNTVEDCLVGGTGRFMIDIYGGGGSGAAGGNVVRRCFVKWSGWDGKNFCGVTWPNSYMIGVYNSSNNTIENSIAYGRGVTGIIVQANSSGVTAGNNQVLGSLSLLMGKDTNGGVWNYGTYPNRPGPTSNPYGGANCDTSVTDWSWPGQRVGFQLFGQGILRDNVFRDNLAANNAGLGFSINNPGGGQYSGNVFDRFTLYGNGSNAPSGDGGQGSQVSPAASSSLTNSRIGSAGTGGAQLSNRYVNRQLTGDPLLPWPMESRAVSELGVSINAIVTSAIQQGGGSVSPAPTAAPGATATPTAALSLTPQPAATKTPVPTSTPTQPPAATSTPTQPPAATSTPSAGKTNGLRINVPMINAPRGDAQLDANNWAIVSLGKMSPSGGYTQARLVGSSDGLIVYVQTMAQTASGTVTLKMNGKTYAATYKSTAGWEFSERCSSGTTGCRGWTASRLLSWADLGGKPAEGTDWAFTLQNGGYEWSGTLHWGLPDYAGRTAAGAQTLTVPLTGDSTVGGGTDCGSSAGPNYFPTWGTLGGGSSPYVNVQAQWDTADWPCYAKYFAAWSLSKLPAGAQVISATVEMRHFGNPGYGTGYSNDGTKDTVMQVYEVNQTWQESSITWDNAPTLSENISRVLVKPIDITCGGKSYCSPGVPYSFDVTEIVKRAQAGGRNWASMALYTAAGQYHSGKYFSSREGGEPPVVRITYVTDGSAPQPTATPAAPTATPVAAQPTATPVAAQPTATPVAAQPTATPTTVAVPFPVTNVLDAYNRANGVVGTKWGGSTSGYRIASQRLDIGSTRDIYWKATKFGANQEAYVTLTTIDGAATQMGLLLKSQSSSSYTSGAIEVLYSPTEGNVQLWTYTAASGWVRNATTFKVAFANGDKLGVRAYASGPVVVFRNGSPLGMWTITNWTYYKSGGYIGIYNYGAANGVMDDFGGGTITADPYKPVGLGEAEPVVDAPVSAAALQSGAEGTRYLIDAAGAPVYMAGASAAVNMQPSADGVALDYGAYLDLAAANHLNAVRLWAWHAAPWMSSAANGGVDMPYVRSGAAPAADGKPQYDLTKFDQAYFDRLHQAVVEADNRGLYVVVELFSSHGLDAASWQLQPFAANNNSNGFNGDANGDGAGLEMAGLADGNVTALQDAYVQKVVATLQELDNVLYQVGDESAAFQLDWKQHMLQSVMQSDQQSTVRHLAGAYAASEAEVQALRGSGASWITVGYADDLAASQAALFAVNPDGAADRSWAWKSLMRGYNVLAGMTISDPAADAATATLLANLGDMRAFALRIGLGNLAPRSELCSTGYCLANQTAGAAAYVAYAPAGGEVSVDLSANPGTLFYEWMNPATGKSEPMSSVEGGGVQTLAAPFAGDAVLYIYSTPEMTSHVYMPVISN